MTKLFARITNLYGIYFIDNCGGWTLPEVLYEHKLRVILLYEDLQMLEGGDDLLHEGGHPLRSLIVNNLLELLGQWKRLEYISKRQCHIILDPFLACSYGAQIEYFEQNK